MSVAKQFATGGLNHVLVCTNLTLAPNRFSDEQTSSSCLGEFAPTHPSTLSHANAQSPSQLSFLTLTWRADSVRVANARKYIHHKKLIALSMLTLLTHPVCFIIIIIVGHTWWLKLAQNYRIVLYCFVAVCIINECMRTQGHARRKKNVSVYSLFQWNDTVYCGTSNNVITV
jgi:hypothetical protein